MRDHDVTEWYMTDGPLVIVAWTHGPIGDTLIGLAARSPLTGMWLAERTDGGYLCYIDGLTQRRQTQTRMRDLTGARMVVLGGNGHRERGHSSVRRTIMV